MAEAVSGCVYVDVGDPEQPEFYRSQVRRARKTHKCCECAEDIKAGYLHEYVVGKWDGEITAYRTCSRCCNVRAEYFKDGWAFGEMAQDWREAHGFDYRDGIPEGFAPCV